MLKQISNVDKLLSIISILAIVMGVGNNNIIISAMFIVTIWCVAKYLKCNKAYDLFYILLMTSAFFDYALFVPRVSSVYMFHIILAIMSVLSLIQVYKDRSLLARIDKKILAIYITWFIYMCISISWSISKGLAIKYVAIYMMMFAFIVNVMLYNTNKENLKKTIRLIIILISLITIVGFVEMILGKQLPIKHYADVYITELPQKDQNYINARPIAFSFNPNNLAATLAILMPFIYCIVYRAKDMWLKILTMVVTIFSFIVIATTSSRTGFIAIRIGIAIFCIYSLINVKRIGIKKMVYPLILIISLSLAYNYSYKLMNIKPVDGKDISSNALSDKMKKLEDSKVVEGGDGSLNVRYTIIKDVVHDIVNEKHYFGFGVGNVEQVIRKNNNTGDIFSPHCYAIEIFGDFGIPGFVLYGIYYLYLLIQNFMLTIRKKNVICFASTLSLLIFAPASFGPSSITYVFSYWILMAISISTIQVYKNNSL